MSHRRHTNRVLASIGAIMLVVGCGNAGTPDSARAAHTTTPPAESSAAPAGSATNDPAAADPASAQPTSADPEPAADRAALQTALDDFVTRSGSPGGIVAVSIGGAAPVVVTSGLADRRDSTPMPPDPRFFVGKIAGQFVTAITLQLVAEGALALDEPVATYVPDAPFAGDVTIRHLLTHTSGYSDWLEDDPTLRTELEDLVAADPARRFTDDDMLDFMRNRPLQFAPGTRALHAEFNTLLLRLAVARVTGQDFGPLLKQRILDPLGLTETTYGFDAAPHAELMPGLYREPPALDDRWTNHANDAAYVTSFYSAAPITSSVNDLIRWGDALYRGTVIPPEIAADAKAVNEFGSALLGIALTERGVCVMLVDCQAGTHDYVGYGQPSIARGAFSGLFYHQPLDAVVFVLVNNTGASIRPLYAAVRQTL